MEARKKPRAASVMVCLYFNVMVSDLIAVVASRLSCIGITCFMGSAMRRSFAAFQNGKGL